MTMYSNHRLPPAVQIGNRMQGMEPSALPGDRHLGEDDCFSILQELEAVAPRWYDIGLALGLRSSALNSIKSKGQDVHELLRNMIIEWLNMNYNVDRFGPPTWRRIVDAVRAKSGGRNPSLADNLEIKYCGKTASHSKAQKHQRQVVQEQPTTHTPPPLSHPLGPSSNVTPKSDTEVHTGSSCCCFGSGSTPERSISYRMVERQGVPNREGVDFIATSAQNNIPGRHFCTSLPPHSRNSMHNESIERSADTVLADPTSEIKDVTTRKGYVGIMSSGEAEKHLRRCRGNCYLIRYSESKQSYILSVVRRDDEYPIPHIQHYKLIITRVDGNNVYEIEGSKEQFSDISELLEFYQTHPLTRSNLTIGDPYVKPRVTY